MPNPALLLDKDGTLIDDVPYNVDPARIRLARGVAEGVRRLHLLGYRLIVISNQPGIARGYFSELAMLDVERRLRELLFEAAAPLTGFYFCPHDPRGRVAHYARHCACRKPAPGLLRWAARRHDLDLSRSWFIGDILDDVEAGNRAGCRTVLLDNGHEHQWRQGPHRRPDRIAADLLEAAKEIAVAEGVGVGIA